jgi:predicted nucleic acid-binding protein
VFIDHLRGARRITIPGGDIAYSVVTRCELFAGANVDEGALHLVLAPFTELPVDRGVAERGGRIRRETGTHVADALIVATALEHGLTLITRNLRHFDRIPGLSVRHSLQP